jgi:hypothetical protein
MPRDDFDFERRPRRDENYDDDRPRERRRRADDDDDDYRPRRRRDHGGNTGLIIGLAVGGGALLIAALVLVLLLTKDSGPGSPPEDPRAANDLRDIGMAYHMYSSDFRRPPAGAHDLRDEMEMQANPSARDGIQSGRYVVYWNANIPNDFPMGTSNTVLGYERDVPVRGGSVLMADGAVKTVSAQEFRNLPRPRGR